MKKCCVVDIKFKIVAVVVEAHEHVPVIQHLLTEKNLKKSV